MIKEKHKKMNYFTLHTVLFVAILLLIIVTFCCYCIKHGSKRKRQTIILNNIKTESNNKLKEISILNRAYYYFDDIINTNDLDLDNPCAQSAFLCF